MPHAGTKRFSMPPLIPGGAQQKELGTDWLIRGKGMEEMNHLERKYMETEAEPKC